MAEFHRDNPAQEKEFYEELAQRQANYKRAKYSVTKDDALRATAIAKAYPNFSPDIITALTTLQVKPEAQVLQDISRRIAESNSQTIIDKIFEPIQAGVRLGFLGLEDLYRTTVDRPINSFIAATFGDNAENLSFADAYKQSGKSTVKQYMQQLQQGKKINIGQGFLPQSEVFDPANPQSKFYDEYQYMIRSGFDEQRAQSIIQNYLGTPITSIDKEMQEGNENFTISNEKGTVPISLGRTLALQVAEPNTRTFNVVSGLLDAGKVLFLDPANYLTFGLKAFTKGSKALKIPDYLAKQLDEIPIDKLTKAQKEYLGAVNKGWGLPFISGRSVSNYLAKDPGGKKLIDYLAKLDSPDQFIELTGITDREAIVKFMEISQDFTKTEAEKIELMGNLVQGFLEDPFGPFGTGVKPTVGSISRFLGGATEQLLGGVPKGTGALFGAKKVIKSKLMDSPNRSARILATYAGEFPYRYLDSDQLDDAVQNVKGFLDQTTVSKQAKDQILNRAIRLQDGDQVGLFNVAKDMVTYVADDLVENYGVNAEDAQTFKTLFDDYLPELRAYFIDAITGNNVANPGAKMGSITVDGQRYVNPDPHLLTEFINRTIPLPDPTQLSKAMNSMALIRAKASEAGIDFFNKLPSNIKQGTLSKIIDSYYSDFWKPFVLLRGAWLLRVVGEEQLRMYTKGYDNIFSRPLSVLSLGLLKKADKTEAARWTQKGVTFNDILGNPLEDAIEWQAASSRRYGSNNFDHLFGGAYKAGKRRKKPGVHPMDVLRKEEALRQKETKPKLLDKYFDDGVLREVSHLHYDRLFNFLFRGAASSKARQQRLLDFVQGDSALVEEIIEAYGKGGPQYKARMSTAGGRYAYAESIIARVNQLAGGAFTQDLDVLDDLAKRINIDELDLLKSPFPLSTEKIANQNLLEMLLQNRLGRISNEFIDEETYGKGGATLDNLFEELRNGDKTLYNKVKNILMDENGDYFKDLPEILAVGKTEYIDEVGKLEFYTNKAFDALMGQRTDNASRSPVFRQAYWRTIYDLLEYMSPKMRQTMLEGGTYTVGGKEFKVAGAYNANLPGENLIASIKADLGLSPQKLRKQDTEINIDMFERKVKELNLRDKELDLGFEDVDEQWTKFQTEYSNRKSKLEQEILDKELEIEKLQRDVTGTYGSGAKISDPNVPDWVKQKVEDIEDDIYLLKEKIASNKELFTENLEKKSQILGFTDKSGDVDLIDRVAKARALTETQELLYDLTKRKKMTYNLRGLFPFGEAYVEILTTWAKLLKDNPEILRRGQVTINALRSDNVFSPVEGEGFLGQDEVTGEEVFYYPLVDELVSDALFGEERNVGVRLPGYASSLNLAMEVIPGIGPAVAIPASFFINASPNFDEAKKILFPYGLPDVRTAGDFITAVGVPAWLRNTYQALYAYNEDVGQNEITRIASNTTIDVYRILKANGRADRTAMQQEDLMKESRSIARNLTLIKAFSQFVGPTGLNPRFDIGNEKNGGHVYSMQILSDRYRELLETPPKDPMTGQFLYAPGDNYSATKYFTDEFGFNPLDIATPKTVIVEPRPVDERGVKFQKDNPDLFKEYSFTAQYAIPNGGGGPFDYEAYVRTIANEQREPLTPEEWLAKRNQALGEFYMEEKRIATLQTYDITDPYQNAERNRSLALERDIARNKFPGFDSTVPGLPQTATLDMQFEELKRWKDSPKLMSTQVGKDLSNVLTMIKTLEKRSIRNGLSKDGWKTSRIMVGDRQKLRDMIGTIINRNPDFQVLAERVLLPLFQERMDFLEDLQYDYDTLKEYGVYLPQLIDTEDI
jgi:hypothetical protein